MSNQIKLGINCGTSRLPRGEYSQITDDSWCLGSVYKNMIIINLDMGQDGEEHHKVFDYIIRKAIPLLTLPEGGIVSSEVKPETQEDMLENIKKSLVPWLSKGLSDQLNRIKNDQTHTREEVQRYVKEIVKLERDVIDLAREYLFTEQLMKTPNEERSEEEVKKLRALLADGAYTKFYMNGKNFFCGETPDITVTHNDCDFPVGQFTVRIDLNGSVKITNHNQPRGAEYPHPHVSYDGKPCWGNVQGDVAIAIGRFQLSQVFGLAHALLCSYNSGGGPFEDISRFDPNGDYEEEKKDLCEECEDVGTPYCAQRCDNRSGNGCDDCDDRSNETYCFDECDYNEDWGLRHPCCNCAREGEQISECPYREDSKGRCDKKDNEEDHKEEESNGTVTTA